MLGGRWALGSGGLVEMTTCWAALHRDRSVTSNLHTFAPPSETKNNTRSPTSPRYEAPEQPFRIPNPFLEL